MIRKQRVRFRPAGPLRTALLITLVAAGCARAPAAARCPGEFSPNRLTKPELVRHGIGDIPERPATTLENVRWAVEHRRGWIQRNYADVVDVDVGPGWGLSYTNNQYGDTTYHHGKDYMVVTVVSKKASCPDPQRGQLFVLAQNNTRVPVRFEYRPD